MQQNVGIQGSFVCDSSMYFNMIGWCLHFLQKSTCLHGFSSVGKQVKLEAGEMRDHCAEEVWHHDMPYQWSSAALCKAPLSRAMYNLVGVQCLDLGFFTCM